MLHYPRVERLARDKHSSLTYKFISYKKKGCEYDFWSQCNNPFYGSNKFRRIEATDSDYYNSKKFCYTVLVVLSWASVVKPFPDVIYNFEQ